jgi:type II secretory pathway component GspD/PulD (secretin)
MEMKTNRFMYVWGCLAALCLAGSLSMGQDAIADDDLLKMLENAGNGTEQPAVEPAELMGPEPPAETPAEEPANPVEEAALAADAAAERADEADAVMNEDAGESEEGAPEAADDGMIDDVGMVTYDEASASSEDELISVRLNKVGLEEAINLFAQLSGANIIVPELTEAAQISVNLENVEWRPALQSILDAYNYELYQKVSGSNVYSVRRRPAGAPEPQVVETFILRYATVPNAATLVRELLPEDAKISEFASRNMLVVKSTESSLSEVRTVLKTIDTMRQQVYIESKFMELNDRAQKDLGIDWQVLQAYGLGTEGSTVYGYGRDQQKTDQNNSFSDLSGTPYNEGEGFLTSGPLNGNDVLEGLTPTKALSETDITSKVMTSVLDADEFRLVLSALEDNKGVNVVSNPKVIVANEEQANISIVRKEPNLKQERQQTASAAGGAAIDNIVFSLDPDLPFFEYGIKLDVTPSVNTSSNITIAINPSLTRFVENKKAGDNTYPIYDEKSIETVFNLASGQTAAIGGLTEVQDSEQERKVPVLGSIPLLGRLFSWKQTISDQRETIIFVTVGLANTQMLDIENSLPEDSELARRRLIKDNSKRLLREQGRENYQLEEEIKIEDLIEKLDEKERKLQEKKAKEESEASEEALASL